MTTFAHGAAEGELMTRNERLLPCPDSPNCVSTLDAGKRHAIAPYHYRKSLNEAKAVLKQVLREFPRTTLVKEEENFLHYEVRSAMFGFVDDVEFMFDEVSNIIHFRSAARKGFYDFGVNRRRMENIRGLLEDTL
jgi:uncharacterized protein (DUF1499 family)